MDQSSLFTVTDHFFYAGIDVATIRIVPFQMLWMRMKTMPPCMSDDLRTWCHRVTRASDAEDQESDADNLERTTNLLPVSYHSLFMY